MGRGGFGGWLGLVCSEKPEHAIWFRAVLLPTTEPMGPALCLASLQCSLPWGPWGTLPWEGLAFLAYLRNGLDFQVWILLLFTDILRGVQRMAGNAAAPQVLSPGRYCSALAEAGRRQGCPGDLPLPGGGSAMSLQRDVMFPVPGRKGLWPPVCEGIQDIACWGSGTAGCTPSLMSPAPLQGLRSLEL